MKRQILKSLKLTEISACDRPAQTGAVVRIMKSADVPAPQPQFRKPTGAGEESLRKMLAAMRAETIEKSQKEEVDMSDETYVPNRNYNHLVKSHADRMNLSESAAAVDLLKSRRDLVEAAYQADETDAATVARRARDSVSR
jgi:hypothetical protein